MGVRTGAVSPVVLLERLRICEGKAVPRDDGAGATETIVGDESVGVAGLGVGRGGHHDGLSADGDGVVLDWLDAHALEDDVERGDRETVADDGEDNEEIDGSREGPDQVVELRIGLACLGDDVADVLDVEYGTDADGAKVAHE